MMAPLLLEQAKIFPPSAALENPPINRSPGAAAMESGPQDPEAYALPDVCAGPFSVEETPENSAITKWVSCAGAVTVMGPDPLSSPERKIRMCP